MARRIGILGGSFDPVHYAHLLLAETARESLTLDSVWFIPAASPPHKPHLKLAPAQNRIDMLRLAIADHPALEIQTYEVDRGGVSFTVDTLEHCHQLVPDGEFYLILGADALHDLPGWHRPERICELAVVAFARRPGAPPPDLSRLSHLVSPERLKAIEEAVIEMPLMEISSTDLRQRVRDGRSIRFRTPRAVERYIATHTLYAKN